MQYFIRAAHAAPQEKLSFLLPIICPIRISRVALAPGCPPGALYAVPVPICYHAHAPEMGCLDMNLLPVVNASNLMCQVFCLFLFCLCFFNVLQHKGDTPKMCLRGTGEEREPKSEEENFGARKGERASGLFWGQLPPSQPVEDSTREQNSLAGGRGMVCKAPRPTD